MKKLIIYLLTVLSAFAVSGQNPADSAKVLFNISQRQFDPSLGDNRASMGRFVDIIRKADASNDIDHIIVRAYSSPDGKSDANERLAERRCDAIVAYIIDATGVNPDLIKKVPEGVAWSELRRLVAANPDVPSKQKILDILDNTPVWVTDSEGKVIDSRKKQLMQLDGGDAYRWLFDNIFPQLRNAVAASLYLKSDLVNESPAALAQSAQLVEEPVNNVTETVAVADTLAVDTVPADTIAEPVVPSPGETLPPFKIFALKNNILYDAALMPNLEFEWMINKYWSVAAEVDVAWWRRDSRHKYYQLAAFQGEGRRWIRPRAPWHGLYVGLFAGGGKYDLENGGKGYKGEAGLAGVSVGYMFPISSCLSFEAAIGAGYMFTRYKEYHPYDGHYLYERTKDLNYFGPLKAKFAIVWRFFDINKHKKVNTAI